MMMECTNCNRKEDFSPLRLGRTCGKCKAGKFRPVKIVPVATIVK
jgi:hypothetical protein